MESLSDSTSNHSEEGNASQLFTSNQVNQPLSSNKKEIRPEHPRDTAPHYPPSPSIPTPIDQDQSHYPQTSLPMVVELVSSSRSNADSSRINSSGEPILGKPLQRKHSNLELTSNNANRTSLAHANTHTHGDDNDVQKEERPSRLKDWFRRRWIRHQSMALTLLAAVILALVGFVMDNAIDFLLYFKQGICWPRPWLSYHMCCRGHAAHECNDESTLGHRWLLWPQVIFGVDATETNSPFHVAGFMTGFVIFASIAMFPHSHHRSLDKVSCTSSWREWHPRTQSTLIRQQGTRARVTHSICRQNYGCHHGHFSKLDLWQGGSNGTHLMCTGQHSGQHTFPTQDQAVCSQAKRAHFCLLRNWTLDCLQRSHRRCHLCHGRNLSTLLA